MIFCDVQNNKNEKNEKQDVQDNHPPLPTSIPPTSSRTLSLEEQLALLDDLDFDEDERAFIEGDEKSRSSSAVASPLPTTPVDDKVSFEDQVALLDDLAGFEEEDRAFVEDGCSSVASRSQAGDSDSTDVSSVFDTDYSEGMSSPASSVGEMFEDCCMAYIEGWRSRARECLYAPLPGAPVELPWIYVQYASDEEDEAGEYGAAQVQDPELLQVPWKDSRSRMLFDDERRYFPLRTPGEMVPVQEDLQEEEEMQMFVPVRVPGRRWLWKNF